MQNTSDLLQKTTPEYLSGIEKLSSLMYNEDADTDKRQSTQHVSELKHLDDTTENKERVYEWRIKWLYVIALLYVHVISAYAVLLGLTGAIKTRTLVFGWLYGLLGGIGITAGVHRLWSHRAYQANWQLRTLLMICQTIAVQNHIVIWSRDHRLHHTFTDTDADPHNSRRGVFFSHIGWIMLHKHPEFQKKVKELDFSDLERDPVVKFQKRYYFLLVFIFALLIPMAIPCYFWGETMLYSWYNTCIRWTIVANTTFLINSAGHSWGNKPYVSSYSATENRALAFCAAGEGWHNYHHAYPWDYKSSELRSTVFNPTTVLIDVFAKMGWVTNLRTASTSSILNLVAKSGDGTHSSHRVSK